MNPATLISAKIITSMKEMISTTTEINSKDALPERIMNIYIAFPAWKIVKISGIRFAMDIFAKVKRAKAVMKYTK